MVQISGHDRKVPYPRAPSDHLRLGQDRPGGSDVLFEGNQTLLEAGNPAFGKRAVCQIRSKLLQLNPLTVEAQMNSPNSARNSG
jgi:hypothetical protein